MSVSKFRKIRDKLLASHIERDKLRKQVEKMREELQEKNAWILLLKPPKDTIDPVSLLPPDYLARAMVAMSRWTYQGCPLQYLRQPVLAAILCNEFKVTSGQRQISLADIQVTPGDTLEIGGVKFIYS